MGIDEAWDCSNPNCDSQFFYYDCQFCGKESCAEAFINSINVKDNDCDIDNEELRYCDEQYVAYLMCNNCTHYQTFISFVSKEGKVYSGTDLKCVYIPEEETKGGIWRWTCDDCDQTTVYETQERW
jgi:hypothetical protein